MSLVAIELARPQYTDETGPPEKRRRCGEKARDWRPSTPTLPSSSSVAAPSPPAPSALDDPEAWDPFDEMGEQAEIRGTASGVEEGPSADPPPHGFSGSGDTTTEAPSSNNKCKSQFPTTLSRKRKAEAQHGGGVVCTCGG